MKSDRELLECAAKAFGLKGHYAEKHPEFGDDWVETGFWYNNEDDCTTAFNSLTSDGDALRLAVKLEIEVRNFDGASHAGKQGKFWCTEKWFPNGDALAATRRVITRAATKIVSPTK